MSVDFFLINGGFIFQFPVNPEEVNISRQKGYETITMLTHGEFDFPQGEKVKEITFSSFFPKVYDASFCRYKNIPDPNEAMNMLNAMLKAEKPCQFIITNTLINVPVYIIAHNTTFRGGESGDIYFEITLRTWREPKIALRSGSSAQKVNASNLPRTNLKTKPKTYTVKAGDSLSKIAKLELGDSSKWKNIYQMNKKVIGNNPNLIKVGQKLVMP
ncbi:LysM peptidoglycan-binding domain-containing protein [Paenibacillus medicaginis]|uniref:LysM peptidoglycan-binding domain-containing protein n=1 Tax=Paenibacillus medicaginis TaxID=1470560 RepID=A0ABV5C723_9BACL